MADSVSASDWNSGRGVGWDGSSNNGNGSTQGGGKNVLATQSLSGGNDVVGSGGTLEETFKDATLAPCFITKVEDTKERGAIRHGQFKSTRFFFRNPSHIVGMHIWGASTTARWHKQRDNSNLIYVPNSHFGLSDAQVQTIRSQTDRNKVLNAWVYQLCQSLSVTNLRQIQSNETLGSKTFSQSETWQSQRRICHIKTQAKATTSPCSTSLIMQHFTLRGFTSSATTRLITTVSPKYRWKPDMVR